MRDVVLADGSPARVGDDRVSWDEARDVLRELRRRTCASCREVSLSRRMPLGVGMTWSSRDDGTLDRAAVGVRGLMSERRVGAFELTQVLVAGFHETRHLEQESEVLSGGTGRDVERLSRERMVRWRNPGTWGDLVNYGRWFSEADAECAGVTRALDLLSDTGLDGERFVGEYVDVMSEVPYHAMYGLGGLGVREAAESALVRARDAHYVLSTDFDGDELVAWMLGSEDGVAVRSAAVASGDEQVRMLSDVMVERCPERAASIPLFADVATPRAGHVSMRREASASVPQEKAAPTWSSARLTADLTMWPSR